MRLRSKLAIRCAKLTSTLIKKLNRGSGVTLPGYVARLIDPKILSVMSGMVREKTIVTMGTNGKTTTNSILYHALKAEGKTVIINRTGANMLNGIISAFVLATDRKGRLHADYACIEVDEIASVRVLPQLKPDCALLTNISRDQLDRFGEVDITYNKIKTAVLSVPETKLILNCDDILSYTLTQDCKNSYVTYGISEQIFDDISRSEIRESIFCRSCGKKLSYDFFHYGQLGIYHCPNCGLKRPAPDYTAENIVLHDTACPSGKSSDGTMEKGQCTAASAGTTEKEQRAAASASIMEKEQRAAGCATQGSSSAGRPILSDRMYSFTLGGMEISSPARSPYNIYNTLSAYAALCALQAPMKKFKQTIEGFDYGNNRESVFMINGARVQLHLAKNPIGFQQKISLVLKDPDPKDVIIQINDTYQDGEDISWLWDVDFQYLANANAATITTNGTRRHDMGLRLKYEDIPCSSTTDLRKTVEKLTAEGTKNLYVIVNYSGLYRTNHMLTELQSITKGGATS